MGNKRYSIFGNPNYIPVIHSSWYPPIVVTEKNSTYAYMLTHDLADASSEMTSVHQYLFQSWNIEKKYNTIQNVINRIAEVEIHHFRIIGQLITLLGENAGCWSIEQNNQIIWNGSMINYTVNIKQMCESNREAEQGATNTYLEQSKIIKDPLVSRVLFRLSQDEALHYEIFKSFCEQLS